MTDEEHTWSGDETIGWLAKNDPELLNLIPGMPRRDFTRKLDDDYIAENAQAVLRKLAKEDPKILASPRGQELLEDVEIVPTVKTVAGPTINQQEKYFVAERRRRTERKNQPELPKWRQDLNRWLADTTLTLRIRICNWLLSR